MPDSAPPHRRFQFRLRTLLIVVTLLAVACAYFARPMKIARNRNAMLGQIRLVDQGDIIRYGHEEDGLNPPAENTSGFPVSWERRLFGDEAIAAIFLPLDTEKKHLADIHAMFPEARIAAFTATSPESVRRFIKWFDFANDAVTNR
jgi:hypothetical protein